MLSTLGMEERTGYINDHDVERYFLGENYIDAVRSAASIGCLDWPPR